MKIKIRQGVFETNSSSVHAICISRNAQTKCMEDIITITTGEFGCSQEEFYGEKDMASYALTLAECNGRQTEMEDVLRKLFEESGSLAVFFEYNGGYVDHPYDEEKKELLDKLINDEKYLKDFVFGKGNKIVTNYDNIDGFNEYFEAHGFKDSDDDYERFYKMFI